MAYLAGRRFPAHHGSAEYLPRRCFGSQDWQLEQVVVTPPQAVPVRFHCGRWLGARAEDGRCERTLRADPRVARVAHTMQRQATQRPKTPPPSTYHVDGRQARREEQHTSLRRQLLWLPIWQTSC